MKKQFYENLFFSSAALIPIFKDDSSVEWMPINKSDLFSSEKIFGYKSIKNSKLY